VQQFNRYFLRPDSLSCRKSATSNAKFIKLPLLYKGYQLWRSAKKGSQAEKSAAVAILRYMGADSCANS
jgi:hypothetical protein